MFCVTTRGRDRIFSRPRDSARVRTVSIRTLLLALTIAPVLCLLFFKNLKPGGDNLLVRLLKRGYLKNLDHCLNHRWLVVFVFGAMIVGTVMSLPFLGREFMPALEEGHIVRDKVKGAYADEG